MPKVHESINNHPLHIAAGHHEDEHTITQKFEAPGIDK